MLSLSILLVAMAALKYFSLHSTYYDLGIFLNFFFNIAQKEWWHLVIGHFQPLMYIYSQFYNLFPANAVPVITLSIQALTLAWPAILLYKRFGIIPAVAFALYFPLWFNALFDFHMDHLAVPLLFGFFFFEKTNRIGSAMIMALLLSLVKETFALQTAACGLYLMAGRKYWARGSILLIVGTAFFLLEILYILPYFSFADRLSFQTSGFSWLGQNLGEVVSFIFFNPHLVLMKILFDDGKLYYLFYLFAALAFIPFLRLKILLVGLPILGISLLSKEPNHTGLATHYTAGLIAPLIFAFAEGFPTAKQIWAHVGFSNRLFTPILLIIIIGVHIKIAPSPMSWLFWSQNSWAYNFSAYAQTDRNSMIKEAIRVHIPSDPKIVVSAQNTLNWGYLAHREYYFAFPVGVLQPHKVLKGSDRTLAGLWKFINTGEMTKAKPAAIWSDYVVLDLKRLWFLEDKGCAWKNEQCINNEEFSSEFMTMVQQTKEHFDTVFEKDSFYILKRKNL